MNIDKIKEEYFKKLEELNNASTENEEITEFGYRYFDANCSEIYKIVDFANIYTWIEKVLKEQESQIKQSILKAIMKAKPKREPTLNPYEQKIGIVGIEYGYDQAVEEFESVIKEVLK